MSNSERLKALTDRLEKGTKEMFKSDKYKQYLTVMSKFHNYSARNSMLIAMQNPNASRVASFESWQRNFKRSVRKGEKGIQIIAPAVYEKTVETDKIDKAMQKPLLDEFGNTVKEEKTVKIPYFRAAYVFDVSQTSGKPLPELTTELTGSVEDYDRLFKALEGISPYPIEFEPIRSGAKGYCNHVERRIAINEGMSQVQNVKTAIHEIAHATLHAAEFENAGAKSERKDKITKEVEAESVAYTVCSRYGIDTSQYSFGYIAGWSSGKEVPELQASMQKIRDTAAGLIDNIEQRLKVRDWEIVMPDKPTREQMNEYGYTSDVMIPMDTAAAIEYFDKGLTIYALYEDDTESMITSRRELDEHAAYGGLFGIETEDWHSYLETAEKSTEQNYNMIDGVINNIDNRDKDDLTRRRERAETESGDAAEKPLLTGLFEPVYEMSADYARERGETEQWQRSFTLNRKCAAYIQANADEADSRKQLKNFTNRLVAGFGADRALYVAARNIIDKGDYKNVFGKGLRSLDKASEFKYPDMQTLYDCTRNYLCKTNPDVLDRVFLSVYDMRGAERVKEARDAVKTAVGEYLGEHAKDMILPVLASDERPEYTKMLFLGEDSYAMPASEKERFAELAERYRNGGDIRAGLAHFFADTSNMNMTEYSFVYGAYESFEITSDNAGLSVKTSGIPNDIDVSKSFTWEQVGEIQLDYLRAEFKRELSEEISPPTEEPTPQTRDEHVWSNDRETTVEKPTEAPAPAAERDKRGQNAAVRDGKTAEKKTSVREKLRRNKEKIAAAEHNTERQPQNERGM